MFPQNSVVMLSKELEVTPIVVVQKTIVMMKRGFESDLFLNCLGQELRYCYFL